MVECLESQNGFGTAGLTNLRKDGSVSKTVTLSMSGRKHIEIFGSYWPTVLKNWYSDNWAQQVYKNYFCFISDVQAQNTAMHGTRYKGCPHKQLLETLLSKHSNQIYQYLLQHKQEFPMINETIFK